MATRNLVVLTAILALLTATPASAIEVAISDQNSDEVVATSEDIVAACEQSEDIADDIDVMDDLGDVDACCQCEPCCCDCCCVCWSGLLEAWAGYTFLSDQAGTANDPFTPQGREQYASFGLDGRLGTSHGRLWMQADIKGEITSNEFDDRNTSDVNEFNWSAQSGGHVGVRDSCRGYLGGFGMYGYVSPGDGTPQPEGNFSNQHYWTFGGEAQIYYECSTLYFQAGVLDSRGDLDSGIGVGAGLKDGLNNAYFLRGVYRCFPTPCSRLQFELAYADGEQDGPQVHDMDVIEWVVRYDTCWQGHPVFFAYRGMRAENSIEFLTPPNFDTGRFMEHTFLFGISRRRGACDLHTFDRCGASLDFPNFGRWVGAGQILDF